MFKLKNIVIIVVLIAPIVAQAGDLRVQNLKGSWKFSLGFKPEWTKPDFNDSQWDDLFVPMKWEDQGFYGYDGYACYRKKFEISESSRNKDLKLYLGYIDDCDEVYFNGKQIGFSGSFPPNYSTAYSVERKYDIPADLIHYGKSNTLVVRVYDDQLGGGIVNGEIGIYEGPQRPPFEVNLCGLWKFRTGDRAEFKNYDCNDSKWQKITVPKAWESQGFSEYDGYAWYRNSFDVPESLTKDKVVVMLGKIDDFDEVYLNGNYIGMAKDLIDYRKDTRYDLLRVFYIDGKLLNSDKPNVLAVRVLDTGGWGGIYEGPVGIMSQKVFVQYWRTRK